jgi:hypothetical protein
MKYKKEKISFKKGFGERAQRQEQELREQGIFYALGYGQWLDWSSVEPDCLNFVQSFWDEALELFELLSKGDVLGSVNALRKGPWTSDDLGLLLRDLDNWAFISSEERAALGPMTQQTLRKLQGFGIECYHEALCEKHKESVSATEALQEVLEQEGLEFLDTGAYYDKEGNQDGPRDLVVGVPGTGTEYSFQVYHSPRKAEYKGVLPDNVKEAVHRWQGEL